MAAGGWIESHQSLSKHRKLLHLAALLKCDRHKVIGHLHEFWWWALDNADADGTIGRLSDVDLARAAEWPQKRRLIWRESLILSGFIDCKDGLYMIHDWFDFAGKLHEGREMRRISNRKAQQERRERVRQQNVSADGQHASAVYRTDRTVPDRPAAAPPERARARTRPYEGQLLPEISSSPDALMAEHERFLAKERAIHNRANGK